MNTISIHTESESTVKSSDLHETELFVVITATSDLVSKLNVTEITVKLKMLSWRILAWESIRLYCTVMLHVGCMVSYVLVTWLANKIDIYVYFTQEQFIILLFKGKNNVLLYWKVTMLCHSSFRCYNSWWWYPVSVLPYSIVILLHHNVWLLQQSNVGDVPQCRLQ